MKSILWWLIPVVGLSIAGCAKPPQERGNKRILVLGDSLTEGHGLAPEKAYPAVLERLIREKGFPGVSVTADGVSGALSSSGPPRLKRRLEAGEGYDILILALGANDGLRGHDLKALRGNLGETIDLALAKGCRVLLAGMRTPPHHGFSYMGDFKETYEGLAKEKDLRLIPFLLDGVAAKPKLNLDGIHPNEEGHKILARTVFKYLEPML